MAALLQTWLQQEVIWHRLLYITHGKPLWTDHAKFFDIGCTVEIICHLPNLLKIEFKGRVSAYRENYLLITLIIFRSQFFCFSDASSACSRRCAFDRYPSNILYQSMQLNWTIYFKSLVDTLSVMKSNLQKSAVLVGKRISNSKVQYISPQTHPITAI